jgi:probable phosphoglycerate mutase
MTPEIYLIRHGETEWNRDSRIQGRRDSPLTARGREQARRIGQRLATLGLAGLPVSASPLGRVQATLAIIGEQVVLGPVRLDARLSEVALGCWEGLTANEIRAAYPDLVADAPQHGWGFRSPDGETFDAVATRVTAWLGEQTTPVIALAHGMLGRVLRAVYTGMPADAAMADPLGQDVVWHFHDGAMSVLKAGE